MQAKTLAYINVKSSAVEIYGNTFNKWNSLLGLIYLQRSSDYITPVLIHGNTLAQSSVLIRVNVIKLYLFASTKYSDEFVSDNMICAGVQVSCNNYKQNVGL